MRLRRVFLCLLILALTGQVLFATSTNSPDPARLAYFLRTSAAVYEKAGHKDPKWDSEARICLTNFANILTLSNAFDSEEVTNLQKSLEKLYAAKCDDPLVRYLYLRYVFVRTNSIVDIAARYRDVAVALQASDYPAIRKFYAVMRAHDALHEANIARKPELVALRDKGIELLTQALDDRTMPEDEAERLYEWLLPSNSSYGAPKWEFYQKFEPILTKRWADASFAQLLRGKAYLSYAWMARGTGWGYTITEENSKLMEERLDTAEIALARAWKINPRDSRICVAMMNVELLQGQGRDRLELWFQRGMKIDPGSYDLCNAKLWYLLPRWYGSHEEMIAFGMECATNTNWSGMVPEMLAESHSEVSRDFTNSVDRIEYMKRPEVWADIQFSFKRLFEVSPNLTGYHHNYARYAYQAEQYQVFLDQTKLFPWTNYDYFGGEGQFNAMVKNARDKLKKD